MCTGAITMHKFGKSVYWCNHYAHIWKSVYRCNHYAHIWKKCVPVQSLCTHLEMCVPVQSLCTNLEKVCTGAITIHTFGKSVYRCNHYAHIWKSVYRCNHYAQIWKKCVPVQSLCINLEKMCTGARKRRFFDDTYTSLRPEFPGSREQD